MKQADLVEGGTYGYRTRRGEALAPVTFLGPCRQRQCRVRWEDGDLQGLVEWIPTRLLLCPWDQRAAVLRDEERSAAIREADAASWDPIRDHAVCEVMTASGEYTGYSKQWDTTPAAAERFWKRGGLEGTALAYDPLNYTDRHGRWQLTFATALTACEAFAKSEPELVDLYLRGWENKLKAEGFKPGGYGDELLLRWAPAYALARSWGQESKGLTAEQEVKRLRDVIAGTIALLKKYDLNWEAARLEKELGIE